MTFLHQWKILQVVGLGRRYWMLWTSSGAANLADGIFQVALALLAVRLTRSPALVAGIALAARLPWLVVALPAGALADRLDRRRTMVAANAARVIVLAALAVAWAGGHATIPLLYGVALVLGVAEVLFDTSAQTLMPAMVERHQLSSANGRLFAAELVTNQFVGPPLGGLLVATSAGLAIATSSATYAAATVVLALIPGSYRTERQGPATRLRADVASGLRYLGGHRVLRTLALLLGAQNLLGAAHGAVFVLYATSPTYGLGLDEGGVGVLFAVTAAGAFAASFAAAPIERRLGRTNVLTLTVSCTAISLLVPGVTRSPLLVAAAGMLMGTAALWNVITVSLRQRIIPDHLLGRVNSAYRLVGWGSMPVGAGVGGLIAQLFGVRTVFLLCGALVVALVVPLRLIVTDAAIEAAEGADGAAPADGTPAPV